MRLALATVIALGMAMAQEHSADKWNAPDTDAARHNPLKSKQELAAGGKKLFAKHCASCHDAPGRKGPELTGDDIANRTDGELFWKISHGNTRTGMPSFGSLPEGQRWQVVLYLRTLSVTRKGRTVGKVVHFSSR